MTVYILLLVFITILLFTQSLYYLHQSRQLRAPKRVRQRLKSVLEGRPEETESPSLLKSRLMSANPSVNRILSQIAPFKKLEELLVQADLDWSVGRFLMMTSLLGIGSLLAAHLFEIRIGVGVSLAAAVGSLPFLVLWHRKRQRMRAFEKQLPDLLDLVARSLRAGHSLNAAIGFAGQESPEPVGSEFSRVFDEINFGMDLPVALDNLTRRVDCEDLRYLIAAIRIQRETGGNLGELLDRLSYLIRERFKLLGQTRALTAQGRLSGYILAALPIGMGFLLYLTQPDYILPLMYDPTGQMILGVTAGLQLLGFLIIQKIVNIEVL